MTTINKKALLWGGGVFVGVLVIYLLFKKKKVTTIPTNNGDVKPNNGGIKPSNDKLLYPTLVFSKQGTRLREEPNTDSKILDTFDLGVMLYPDDAVTMPDGVWYHVSEGGWVRSDVVKDADDYSGNLEESADVWVNPGFFPKTSQSVDDMFTLSKSGSNMTFEK